MLVSRKPSGNATLRLAGFLSITIFIVTAYLFVFRPAFLEHVSKHLDKTASAWYPSAASSSTAAETATATNKSLSSPSGPTKAAAISKTIVASSVKGDDISWMHEFLPDWEPNVYVMNDPTANLTVAQNKGNEAAAYLTYLIDNYNNLPDIMVFIHALRYQWHNEDPMYDHVPVLQNLSLSHVTKQGYVNLRCTWDVGCPQSIRPVGDDAPDYEPHWPFVNLHKSWSVTFKELFPGSPLPAAVGAPCCSQFALTKETVHMRSLEDYERYRRWLWSTDMDSMISGRVMEYMWHSKFPKFIQPRTAVLTLA